MAFVQQLGQMRSPAATYAALPITGNVLGDLRLITDLGSLYTWMKSSGSGSLSDWKKVTVSSYNDLTNRPSSSQLDIDNCVTAIRNIFMNYILIFFKKTITYGMTIQKMYDGLLDNFESQLTVDETESENYLWLKAQGVNTYDYFYVPRLNSDLDSYTKLLMHGDGAYCDSGFDSLRTVINNIWKEESGGHFQDECIRTSPYGVGSSTAVSTYTNLPLTAINGLDITWDFWYKELAPAGDKNVITYDTNGFNIQKLANDKIYVNMPTCDGYVWDDGLGMMAPINPGAIEVTSTTALSSYTWYHVAVQRRSGYLELYINGIKEATSLTADNRMLAGNGYVMFGLDSYPTWLDEVRYSHGIARYTSNFTPMTVQYDAPTEESPCDNMSIQSSGFEANAIPTSARIVIFQDYTNVYPEEVLPNDDMKAFVSRDGGTTFTEVELTREMDIIAEKYSSFLHSYVNFYVGTVDLHLQPNGKEMVWKITTHNNKRVWIRSVGLNWK